MNHPLVQLFLARLREFYREPEVLFWVYGFPLLMAVGLGVAFANKKPEPSAVDVQGAPEETAANREILHQTFDPKQRLGHCAATNSSCTSTHATLCPPPVSTSGGTASRHFAIA